MSEKIVITKIGIGGRDLLLCGRMNQNRLIEVRLGRLPSDADEVLPCSSSVNGSLLNGIYIGKVQRVLSDLNAAFVEIAPGVPCYLPLDRVVDPIMVKSNSPGKITQGDEILVQVCRDASKGKSPTLSTNLCFSGRYCILSTENRKLGFSSKLDRKTRDRFKHLLGDSMPAGCGIIVRTNAQHAKDEEFLSEVTLLSDQKKRVVLLSASHTCFSCLYRPDPLYLSYLEGAYVIGLDEIVTDLPIVYEELGSYCSRYSDLSGILLRLYEDASFPLVSLYNLNREIVRATSREVRLRSGGFLVIDPTEAMTVIDVNSGKSVTKNNRSEHLFRINLEASKEIALQLRLRNLSGIIVVDYIDLETAEQKRELLEDLKRLVTADPVPVQVHDITALNLVEITRKKAEKSLAEQIKQLTMENPL